VQVQTSLVVELDATPNYLETVQVTATKSAQSVGDVAAPTATVSRGTIERRGDLRVTLSARNLFNAEYSFDGNSESADPGPTRQVLLSTTIRLR
jgi:outer membrane receptor protein involved in Fe transport